MGGGGIKGRADLGRAEGRTHHARGMPGGLLGGLGKVGLVQELQMGGPSEPIITKFSEKYLI